MKKLFNDKGYTLIELLAVIIIMVAVGMIIVSILVSALRGGNRSQTTNEVRESGNYVMSQMSKMITFAKHLDGLSTGATDVNGNLIYVTNCVLPAGSPTPTPVLYHYIKITSFDQGQTTFSCSGTTITSTSTSGTFPLVGPGFTVTNCSFTCAQANLSMPPTINISFTLSENKGSFTEKQAFIPFDTSVTLRNSGD